MSTTESFRIFKLMVEFLGYGIKNGHALFHNLWSYSVTGQNSNIQSHIIIYILMCY